MPGLERHTGTCIRPHRWPNALGEVAMYPLLSLAFSGAIVLGTASGVFAQEASKQSEEQVCHTRADELKMAADLRDAYMRECLAGERLRRGGAERK